MAQLLRHADPFSASAALEQALLQVEALLAAWAAPSNAHAFHALLLQVFGAPSPEVSSALGQSISGEGLAIPLEILDGEVLRGIKGAYTSADPAGAERIYLNADWLQSATALDIEAVLLEEIGHAIDFRLNGASDTRGDEGEIFAALLNGQTPASSAFSENDQRLISLKGISVVIETADNTAPTGSLRPTAPAYAAPATNPFGISDVGSFASPAFADADADGDLDLFIGNRDGNTLFFRNTAPAGASAPAYAAAATNPFGISDVGSWASPAFADADADGDLDLFIGEDNGNTLFFRNTAAAGAPAPAYAAATTNPFGISDVGYRASPAFADADADGDLDFFIGDYNGNTLFFRNTAAAGAPAPAYAAATINPFGIS
ncbi:MAG: FG-GAP-like repeat-containing protein, partial [Synechococcaceae cyanobacterium]|nr:FG-GAP-like repeat-containing protein [Synechococcaceae cyanobacterium]